MVTLMDKRKKISKTIMYTAVVILVLTSVAAGILFLQGRMLLAEANDIPCAPLNLPEKDPVGIYLNRAPVCPSERWDKQNLGDNLTKAAKVLALGGVMVGFAGINIGAALSGPRSHR